MSVPDLMATNPHDFPTIPWLCVGEIPCGYGQQCFCNHGPWPPHGTVRQSGGAELGSAPWGDVIPHSSGEAFSIACIPAGPCRVFCHPRCLKNQDVFEFFLGGAGLSTRGCDMGGAGLSTRPLAKTSTKVPAFLSTLCAPELALCTGKACEHYPTPAPAPKPLL